jgi:hypothetical protein
MASPSGKWRVSWASSRYWDDGKRASGFMVFKKSLALIEDLEFPLIGRDLVDGETLHLGSLVRFSSRIAKIEE